MGKGHILAPLERIKNIEKNGGGGSTANVKDVIIPLLVDNWEFNEENNTYSQVAIVNGLTDSSNPVILLSSANEQATEEEVNAYICIKESLVADGSITFVADQKPSISISVIVKNVIASNSTVAGDVTDLVNKMNELEAEIDELKVSLKDIAIPLLANEWILDETENVWKQTATIVGLPADSNPIIVLSPENEDPTEDELSCFDLLLDETIVEEGSITFVATEAPLFSFTVIAKGVMASEGQAIADVTALVSKVNGLENEIDELNSDIVYEDLTTNGVFAGSVTRSINALYIDIPVSYHLLKNYSFALNYVGITGINDYTASHKSMSILNNLIRFELTLTSDNSKYVGYTAVARFTLTKK